MKQFSKPTPVWSARLKTWVLPSGGRKSRCLISRLVALCDGLLDICRDPSRLNDRAAVSRATFDRFYHDTVGSLDALMKHVKV